MSVLMELVGFLIGLGIALGEGLLIFYWFTRKKSKDYLLEFENDELWS